jgi:hypothetical protein
MSVSTFTQPLIHTHPPFHTHTHTRTHARTSAQMYEMSRHTMNLEQRVCVSVAMVTHLNSTSGTLGLESDTTSVSPSGLTSTPSASLPVAPRSSSGRSRAYTRMCPTLDVSAVAPEAPVHASGCVWVRQRVRPESAVCAQPSVCKPFQFTIQAAQIYASGASRRTVCVCVCVCEVIMQGFNITEAGRVRAPRSPS